MIKPMEGRERVAFALTVLYKVIMDQGSLYEVVSL
jgi:hypothetical protein